MTRNTADKEHEDKVRPEQISTVYGSVPETCKGKLKQKVMARLAQNRPEHRQGFWKTGLPQTQGTKKLRRIQGPRRNAKIKSGQNRSVREHKLKLSRDPIYIYIYILFFAYYTSLKYVRVLLLGISLCPWDLSNDVWVLAGLWSNQKSQNNRRLHRSPDFSVNSKLMGIPRGLLDVLYKFYHFLPKEDTVPVSTWTSLTLCNVA